MTQVVPVTRRLGNWLYKNAFVAYRPAYGAYKAWSDRAERKILRELISDGDVVVDAGANIGVYTRFLSECVGARGVVHSFEPAKENFRKLEDSTRSVPNVYRNLAAVAERSYTSQLYLSDDLNVDHRSYAPQGSTRSSIPVEFVALDDYFKPGSRVNLIKMDIQGYEAQAVRGAERVLKENPGIKLMLEFWPFGLRQAGTEWHALLELLERHDLTVRQVTPDGTAPLDYDIVKDREDWYINLLAVRAATS